MFAWLTILYSYYGWESGSRARRCRIITHCFGAHEYSVNCSINYYDSHCVWVANLLCKQWARVRWCRFMVHFGPHILFVCGIHFDKMVFTISNRNLNIFLNILFQYASYTFSMYTFPNKAILKQILTINPLHR